MSVFISYRRSDSEIPANVIFDHLESAFPGKVFFDVDKLEVAEEFPQIVLEAASSFSARKIGDLAGELCALARAAALLSPRRRA